MQQQWVSPADQADLPTEPASLQLVTVFLPVYTEEHRPIASPRLVWVREHLACSFNSMLPAVPPNRHLPVVIALTAGDPATLPSEQLRRLLALQLGHEDLLITTTSITTRTSSTRI